MSPQSSLDNYINMDSSRVATDFQAVNEGLTNRINDCIGFFLCYSSGRNMADKLVS